MSIMLWLKALAEEVPDVTKNNENEVTDVGREKVVVRWFIDDRWF
jgi:hypothetical protein